MKVKSEREVAQSCSTRSDPMDRTSSVHGIFQARVLEWGAITFSMNTKLSFLCQRAVALTILQSAYQRREKVLGAICHVIEW